MTIDRRTRIRTPLGARPRVHRTLPIALAASIAFACGGPDEDLREARGQVSGEPTGSCEADACGGPSFDGTCYCEELCDLFGDCCANKHDVCDPKLSIVTYNAGLAHGAVTFAAERRPKIIEALGRIDADVLCLQEVWTDEDAGAIQAELRSIFPYSFRERTEDTSSSWVPRCAFWSILPLQSCVSTCQSEGKSVFECIADPCKEDYDALSDGCKLCLAANTTSPTSCATWGAKDFGYEGRNGLLLLSRAPIEAPAYVPFDTSLIKRGLIQATIAGARVQCTHMTADLANVPYPQDRPFRSWAEEHRSQIGVLSRASGSECTVLAGDLNTSIEDEAGGAELPAGLASLQALGFEETWSEPKCTFCQENPLTGAPMDVRLDHIMFRGCAVRSGYERVLDASIRIESNGQSYMTRLSDHYGLKAVARFANE